MLSIASDLNNADSKSALMGSKESVVLLVIDERAASDLLQELIRKL